jgi:endonuclease YncB( thermonuclease family)
MSRSRRLLLLAATAACVTAAVAPAAAQASYRGSCLPGGQGPQCHFWNGTVPRGGVGDGDTLTVNYEGKSDRVRVTGIQAMEMTRYSSYPDRRRGECHSVAATNRLESLVKQAGGRVRIGSQDPNAVTGNRIRRSLAVWLNGRWQDVGKKLVAEGHALWLPNGGEYAWNERLSTLSQQAAAAGRRIWDRDFCGAGPGAPAQLSMSLRYNAEGYDDRNVNGEYATLHNRGTRALSIGGWYFRDSALRRYYFPSGASVAPGKSVTLHMGKGSRTSTVFYWGYDKPLFENSGDGGYLFDPQGDLRAWVVYPCRFAC